jgi:tetratricopeptide (TPR) repeat protein
VSERTGGVPLFVEEVTRLLLESGTQAIPPTLQQSLAARLDRLGEAREVAQTGAVLGRDFSYALLSAVAGVAVAAADDHAIASVADRRLQTALERLAEADLLFVEGAPPNASYRFKHALIQDAAHESLLKSRRQALHRRAAEALLSANAEAEAIAHHFTEARLDDAAIKWWGRAGDRALRRSAFQEAIAHLGKAIAMADKAAGAAQRRADAAASSRRRLKLQTDYGQAMMWSKGFERALEACTPGHEEKARERFGEYTGALVMSCLAITTWQLGEIDRARELIEMANRRAAGLGHVPSMGHPLLFRSHLEVLRGDVAAALSARGGSGIVRARPRDDALASVGGTELHLGARPPL